jgi:hypothetical protein
MHAQTPNPLDGSECTNTITIATIDGSTIVLIFDANETVGELKAKFSAESCDISLDKLELFVIEPSTRAQTILPDDSISLSSLGITNSSELIAAESEAPTRRKLLKQKSLAAKEEAKRRLADARRRLADARRAALKDGTKGCIKWVLAVFAGFLLTAVLFPGANSFFMYACRSTCYRDDMDHTDVSAWEHWCWFR